MNRKLLTFLVLALLTLAIGPGSMPYVAAQEATPDAAETHPIVGTWLLDVNADVPDNSLGLETISADGAVIDVIPGFPVGLGTWAPTGPDTANLTIYYHQELGEDVVATLIVRASIEVAADGQGWTGFYTMEMLAPDGSTRGQFGPINATGDRITAEAPGEPVGPPEDLFGPPQDATPAAGG